IPDAIVDVVIILGPTTISKGQAFQGEKRWDRSNGDFDRVADPARHLAADLNQITEFKRKKGFTATKHSTWAFGEYWTRAFLHLVTDAPYCYQKINVNIDWIAVIRIDITYCH